MIISMTGFGQGEATADHATVVVEVRSVNHRFLDYSLKLPRVIQSRELEIKELVRAKLARGRISLSINIESDLRADGVSIDTSVMEKYLQQLREFSKKHDLAGDVDINTLVQLPDAVTVREREPDADTIWPLVQTALLGALDACRAMRADEGQALEKDLRERMKLVGKLISEIERSAPGASQKQAKALKERVQQLVGEAQVSEERMVTEIAMMADRLDFTEEITRLRSHESQFNRALDEGGEVSKKLTYLLQEMHRESSTIGSKASDAEVVQQVVALKEESEKLREQVQNIE